MENLERWSGGGGERMSNDTNDGRMKRIRPSIDL